MAGVLGQFEWRKEALIEARGSLREKLRTRNTKLGSHPETESKDDEKTTRQHATNETTTEK